MLNWLEIHYIESLAVVTGLLYVLFMIKENLLLWLFGIISSGLYVWIFYNSGIYAYSALYLYYVIIGFYGWYNWYKSHGEEEKKLTIQSVTGTRLWIYVIVILILFVPLYLVLRKFAPSDLALVDALLTSGGIVATWMLAHKIFEQWLFWIIIDLLSSFMMIYKGLYPSALLFVIYTLLAVRGYFEWKKKLSTQPAD
jgi:nicotinamide mononucleotide transporter